MAAKAAAAVDPFAAATKKTTSTLKSKSPIYVAASLAGLDGKVIYEKSDIISAIENFAKGHKLEEQGKAMKEQARPVATTGAKYHFTRDWVQARTRPESPKYVTNDIGDGVYLSVSFNDASRKLDDAGFNQLAALIGQKNAEENVIRRHNFFINPDSLSNSAKVMKNGKVAEQNVMDAIKEALQEKFGPSPEVLAGLFQAVEIFETKKGLIDKGLEFVAPGKTAADAERLAHFLEVVRTTIALKPGGEKKEPSK